MRLFYIVLIIHFTFSNCSIGDQQKDYKLCVNNCKTIGLCFRNKLGISERSWYHSLLGWDCQSECEYKCMWEIENLNRKEGRKIYQYHGKWPFRRILGIQEVASSLLSLGNFLAHILGYCHIYKGLYLRNQWFMHTIITVTFVVSCNAWFWSALFHARDVYWTMVMDYLSATGLLLSSLGLSFIRVFHLWRQKHQIMVIFFLFLYFCRHAYTMTMVKFSFSWNMKVAGTIFASYLSLFSFWALYRRKRMQYCNLVLIACSSMIFASILEFFDFPPIYGLLDAHALWHASTIPIILIWYRFYRLDAENNGVEYSKIHNNPFGAYGGKIAH